MKVKLKHGFFNNRKSNGFNVSCFLNAMDGLEGKDRRCTCEFQKSQVAGF